MKKFLKKGVGIVLVLGYLIGYLTDFVSGSMKAFIFVMGLLIYHIYNIYSTYQKTKQAIIE